MFNWSQDDIDLAVKLTNEGFSASKVALELDPTRCLTRSAVLGKMRRLKNKGVKIKTRTKKQANRDQATIKRMKSRANLSKKGHPNTRSIKGLAGPVKSVTSLDAKPSKRLNLMQLNSNTCRYITSDTTKDAEYCGHGIKEGSPYCAAHHALCHMVGSAWGKSKNPMGKRYR